MAAQAEFPETVYDIPTLSLTSAIAAVVAIVAWLTFWKLVPEEESMASWALGATYLSAGLMAIALRGVIPDLVSIVAGNALLAGGIAQIYARAARRMFDLPLGPPWQWINAGIVAVGCAWYSIVQPDVSARIVITSLVNMGMLAALGWLFWTKGDAHLRLVHRVTALIFGMGALLLLLRAFEASRIPLTPDLRATPSIILVLPNLYLQVFLIWLAITIPLGALTRLQRSLAQARDAAEAASMAKSDFLSSMSHELRTPLNAVLGFAQLLEMDKSLDKVQRESVEEIIRGGHHLLELINDLLDLERIESGSVELSIAPVDLSVLCRECSAFIAPLVAARKLEFGLEEGAGVAVRADAKRLKQVLLNLLSNAIKYNRSGGRVRLRVSDDSECVIVEVEDSGQGIAPERLGELFQPFNRLGAERGQIEGSGIGLAISRRLMHMMDGELTIASELGRGTTARLELKRA